MMDSSVRDLLRAEMGTENVVQGEPMAKHTSFRVGGPAEWLIRVDDVEALVRALDVARHVGMPARVVGGGSNILVSDAGIEGMVILNRASEYKLFEEPEGFLLVTASGASLPRLAGEVAKRGAAGLEWGVGVPGTVGGAVVQNAGAWGSEIKDRLFSVELLTRDGKLKQVETGELKLRYRGSAILD
ncbi:MAG: FAD-binding protein, partial [Ardenticatenaceae bacterium]